MFSLLVILAPIGGALVVVAERDLRDIRDEMVSSSTVMGYVVAEYSASAMAFDDKKAAERSLRGLVSVDNVTAAALYDNTGALFADYHQARPDGRVALPPVIRPTRAARTEIADDRVLVLQPVVSRGARVGTLAVHGSTVQLRSRTRAYLWSLGLLGLGVLFAALALALMLERTVSRPLLALAGVARTIAETNDYSVRAAHCGGDEIGLLGGAFNQMLTEVDRQQKAAEQAIQIRDDFLSVASHELKTPLTSLRLQVQGLLLIPPATQTDGDAQRIATTLDVIQRQVTRLDKLIGNLLDVSRIAGGRLVLDIAEVDLATVVREVVSHFEPELHRHQCALERHISGPIIGRWDPLRIDQVVTNLISNAIKYGAGKPIELRVDTGEGKVRVVVRDHGIGIAAADQQRIFNRFERAASLGYGGLGLGLYISRQIVLAHGGAVHVDSAPNAGSTFTVELPWAAEEQRGT